ncbi:MAG: hypothetical protein KME29_12150 [Calothrix sp. FI2-JRJ7]|nr:hypothetical protein [Calothrix sp. FI2-JRJ7]
MPVSLMLLLRPCQYCCASFLESFFDFGVAILQTHAGQAFSDHPAGNYTHLGSIPYCEND